MRAPDRPDSRHAHARARGLLSEYLDGALSARKRSRMERHFRVCQDCRRTVTSVPNTLRMLRSLEVDPPQGLVDGVLGRLDDPGPSIDTPPAGTRDASGTKSRPGASAALGGARSSRALARARDLLAYCLTPAYLRRSIPIALLIGIALTAIYQLSDFIAGRANTGAYIMCACNFIGPFVLVSVGLVMARPAPRRRRS